MKVVKNVCIYIGLIEPLVKLRLQRIVSGFFSTDLHSTSDFIAEDFAVSHIACKSGLLNGINDFDNRACPVANVSVDWNLLTSGKAFSWAKAAMWP